MFPNLPKEKQMEIRARSHSHSRPGMRISRVRLEFEKKRLLAILHRDVEKLLLLSGSAKTNLDKEDREAVVAYLKLVRELQKADREEEAGLTDEQLEKVAKGE